jgi:purine-binding chemotaxis protein CheW
MNMSVLEIIDEEENVDNKYLLLRLCNENFAIKVIYVKEILPYDTNLTSIPGSPAYLLGVVNLRGAAIPVIDLRIKFGFERTLVDDKFKIIIMEYISDNNKVKIGALADKVLDVVYVNPNDFSDPPKLSANWKVEFINGIFRFNESFIISLNIDKILDYDKQLYLKNIFDANDY